MTLTELIAAVYVETRRPDLVDRTKQAVKAATLKLHQLEFFNKDLYEFGFAFTDEFYEQSFDYKTYVPRWRNASYFRIYNWNGTTGGVGQDIEIITTQGVKDEYGADRTNVAYLAGNVYQFRSNANFQYLLVGCYLNPDLRDDPDFESFIAAEYPYAIVYEASRIVTKAIGKDQEAAYFDAMFKEQWLALTTSEIQARGY